MRDRQKVAAALVIASILLLALASAGCAPDFGNLQGNPTRSEIEKGAVTLPEQKARELRVWYGNHDNVWDARVHSLHTCPFLAWTPNAAQWRAGTMSNEAWGEFLHKFFKYKHKEQEDDDDCDCDEQLAPKPKEKDNG